MEFEMPRDFKGIWIPRDIWLDERLTAIDKIICAEVDSLSTSDKGCYASNEYLANFCQCSVAKVSASISKLIEFGYIELKSFDGRYRVLEGSLLKNRSLPTKNSKADTQKIEAINIDSNIVDNSFSLFINKINKQKGDLLKDHDNFRAYLLLQRWIKEQPEFIDLTEDEQRKVLMEI